MQSQNNAQRLLLLSTSTVHGSGYLDYAEAEIHDFLGEVSRVLFVPYALRDRDGYVTRVRERFARMGYGLDSLGDALDFSERVYFISEGTTAEINASRREGGRVIAVGTTLVRALESTITSARIAQSGHGYTRLRITAAHNLRGVDGLITGVHEPEASHLDLLSAFLPPDRIQTTYDEAVARHYLWHEFGDLNVMV